MKIYITLLLISSLLFTNNLSAQDYSSFPILVTLPHRTEFNKSVADRLFRDYQKKINATYTTTFHALIKFHPRVRSSGDSTIVSISGADTIWKVNVDVKMIIHNQVTDEKFDWKKTFEATGIDLPAALADSFNTKMIKNEEVFEDLIMTTNQYIHQEFNLNCSKYIEAAKLAFSNKKLNWAIAILMGISPESNCNNTAQALVNEYFGEYLKNQCNFNFEQWAEKNTGGKMDTKFLERFKYIHSDAPCAESVRKMIETLESADPEIVKLNEDSIKLLEKIKSNLLKDPDGQKFDALLAEFRYVR